MPISIVQVSACDSPITGQQLCAKADVVINVITEAHRFRMVTSGLNPQQLRAHEKVGFICSFRKLIMRNAAIQLIKDMPVSMALSGSTLVKCELCEGGNFEAENF